ncbi:large ribosomal subunit protein mL44-like isoform X1 [Corticium candelabrum]|uniref:large ribosomal subunit protein mL44-like isoform X1 n=1 Tax=Corticium candelabrum TaxID=121492 RepID=UPI002E2576B5|nr:large ribosomal subunit protein mL44-like isoform X1 [Corticium candelabrum]
MLRGAKFAFRLLTKGSQSSGRRWAAATSRARTRVSVIRDSDLVKIEATRDTKSSNWDYETELYALAKRLDCFNIETNNKLLRTALTHKSWVIGDPSDVFDQTERRASSDEALNEQENYNDRLTLLGSTVTSHYVMEFLFFQYPHLPADGLRDLRTFVTEKEMMTRVGENLGIVDLILTKHKLYRKPERFTIICGALLAIIGTIHSEQGALKSRSFVHDFIMTQLAGQDVSQIVKLSHPKFMLQMLMREKNMPPPAARLIDESGRATHMPTFVVGIYSGKDLLGKGAAPSLKRAAHEATLASLHNHFEKAISVARLPSDYADYVPESKINLMEIREKEKEAVTASS